MLAYKRGLDELAKAQASGFEDKEALKAANTLLFKAVVAAPEHTQAWTAIGYLLMLLGDNNRAILYLERAVKVDAENEDAQSLIAHIKHGPVDDDSSTSS